MRSLASLACLAAACGTEPTPQTREFVEAPGAPSGASRVDAMQSVGAASPVRHLGDGRAQVLLDVAPRRYLDDDGYWKPASNELVRSSSGGWENRTNALRTVLPADADGQVAVERSGGGVMAFLPLGMAWCDGDGACTSRVAPEATSGEVDAQRPGRLVYRGAYADVDEEFSVSAFGLKHDVVLLAPPVPPADSGTNGWVSFAWQLRLARGLTPMVDGRPVQSVATTQEAIAIRDSSGAIRMAIGAPRIEAAAADHPHDVRHTMGLYRIAGAHGLYQIELRAPLSWLLEPGRTYPVSLDPTVMMQPEDDTHTGYVGYDGFVGYNRQQGRMVSGTVASIQPGFDDVSGYARFSTAPTQCLGSVDDVDLLVWLANHDNFGTEALPLGMEVRASAVDPLVATDQELFEAIGAGVVYASDSIPRTAAADGSSQWCVDSYVSREYELGPVAAADLGGALAGGWFALGFRSEIGEDTEFDHIDYIGYPEDVPGGCGWEPFPGSRITLRVTGAAKEAPMAVAGGPYGATCGPAEASVQLDGSLSSASGAPLSYEWTTDCPGGLDDQFSPTPILTLPIGGVCSMACTATLTVSDGCGVSSATADVSMGDSESPVVSSGPLDGACLWSPNHKYVCSTDLSGFVQAEDACSSVALTVAGCSSDQPEDAPDPGAPGQNGDGHTTADCVIAPDAGSFCVRSERLGTDQAGRHYGLALVADDGCSPAAPFSASFYVPHDQAPHVDCVDPKDSAFLEVRQNLPW